VQPPFDEILQFALLSLSSVFVTVDPLASGIPRHGYAHERDTKAADCQCLAGHDGPFDRGFSRADEPFRFHMR